MLAPLSKAINAYLNLDPESASRLHKLQGKIITVELLPFHFIFQCQFSSEGIALTKDDLLPAETKMKGTPLQMLGAMAAKENRHQFFSDDLIIEGNAEIGLELVALFDRLDIDWEEYLSRLTGDVPAYHISRFVQGVRHFLRQANTSFTQNVSEYIQEEKMWLPAREALQDFFHDIDQLRMDADRLEARINQLKERE